MAAIANPRCQTVAPSLTTRKLLYHLTPAAFLPSPSFFRSFFVGAPYGVVDRPTTTAGRKQHSHRSYTSLSLLERTTNERTERERKGKGTEREKFHTCAPRVKHAAAALTVTVTVALPSLRARDSLGRSVVAFVVPAGRPARSSLSLLCNCRKGKRRRRVRPVSALV